VQAVARSNKVTVFTHSRPENPMEHNDVYLDDAELTPAGGGFSVPVTANPPPAMVAVDSRGTPAPGAGRITHIVKPGDTLFALALQYGVPVDQIMSLNNLTPESRIAIGRELIIALPPPRPLNTGAGTAPELPFPSVGAVSSGRGTICVRTFLDNDGNGLLLADEPPLLAAGAHIVLLDLQGTRVKEQTLSDQASHMCFSDLSAETYRVLADPPPGYLATLQDHWAVSLPGDATIEVLFGARVDPAVNQPVAMWIPLVIGLGLAAGGIAGLLWWRRRHRPKPNEVYW